MTIRRIAVCSSTISPRRRPFRASPAARAGLEALREAARARAPFDVVLLDYQMPEMDGMGFLRKLRADPAIAATNCVVLSSLGDRIEESRELGVSAWLAKPVRKGQLQAILASATGAASAGAVEARASVRPESTSYAAARVLVAEDNEVNQKVALRVLESFGIEAQLAQDGCTGRSQGARGSVRSRLHGLPDARDGWLRATRAIRAFSRIPIVAMTRTRSRETANSVSPRAWTTT